MYVYIIMYVCMGGNVTTVVTQGGHVSIDFMDYILYIGWSDVTVICGHITLRPLCCGAKRQTVYCVELSGEHFVAYT